MKFPEIPYFSEIEIKNCRASKDFRPIFFELYKYVGTVYNIFSAIQHNSPGIKFVAKQNYSILVGLLNRISRLMLGNIALSHKQKYGEVTLILDRCIIESAINIQWLIKNENQNSFKRFVASGLKPDIILKETIEENISKRNGEKLEIENRMLNSIQNYLKKSNITVEEIKSTKRLPTYEQRISDILGNNELFYTVFQRIGSHHIHGTWSSLLTHYLSEENNELVPNYNFVAIHSNQFISVMMIIISTLKEYSNFIFEGESLDYFNTYLDDILKIVTSYSLESFEGEDN